MALLSYTSVDRIFMKLKRDLGGEYNEGDVIEWTGEALELIGAVKQYEEAVAFIEVRNHQATLPKGLHGIIQIARNNCWSKPADEFCPAAVISEVECTTTSQPCPSTPIVIDCNGQPLQEYDLAYYRPYFDLQYEYYAWTNSKLYGSCYSPVNLATSVFFNNLVCTENDRDKIYAGCKDEYSIILGKTLRLSFMEGQIAVSYLRQVVDEETGYPMIPDHASYTTAVVKYITLKVAERNFYNNRQGSESRVSKADTDWQWYCKQAGNLALMPSGVDEHENLMRQNNYMIPQTNRYYGFFGRLAEPENRKFDNPDGRGYFRGI